MVTIFRPISGPIWRDATYPSSMAGSPGSRNAGPITPPSSSTPASMSRSTSCSRIRATSRPQACINHWASPRSIRPSASSSRSTSAAKPACPASTPPATSTTPLRRHRSPWHHRTARWRVSSPSSRWWFEHSFPSPVASLRLFSPTPIQRKERGDSMNKTDLRVALVTGSSSGIGRATAKALQNAGFRVFGTSRRPAAKSSDGATMLACDVTDERSVAAMVEQALATAGRIDLLVNNAGLGLLGGAEESSIAQAQALFDVNVFGVFRVTNAVLPTMRRQGKGRIVNLSSAQGFIPAPYFALYSSTKHAVEGYSESLDH